MFFVYKGHSNHIVVKNGNWLSLLAKKKDSIKVSREVWDVLCHLDLLNYVGLCNEWMHAFSILWGRKSEDRLDIQNFCDMPHGIPAVSLSAPPLPNSGRVIIAMG